MRSLLCISRRVLLSSLLASGVLQSRVPQNTGCDFRNPSAMAQAASRGHAKGLNLVLLGDIMLGRYVDDEFETPNRKRDAFGSVLPYIRQFDPANTIVAGNLECAVTKHNVPTPKAFNFKLSPHHAEVLQELNLAYASLANNHVLDYELQGLQETEQVLDRIGVSHSGSGTLPEAAAPAFVSKAGYRVAFLSYSDHYDEWAASTDIPGINFINPASYKKDALRQQVAAARAQGADLVLVFIHWGPNWAWRPSGQLRQLGSVFLDAGADLVFGHSAHHIQGVQLVGHKAIIYGAGGFIDDYATDEHYRNDLGCIWLATFAPAIAAAAADHSAAQAAARPAAVLDTGPDSSGPDAAVRLQATGGRDQQQQVWAGSSSSGGLGGGVLQLQSLKAVPIFIHHDWREGVRYKEPGQGSPPYFSQVDLAHGNNYAWVANKLEGLCAEFGTSVVQLPGDAGLQLLGGKLQP